MGRRRGGFLIKGLTWSRIMRFSRLGIFALLTLTVLVSANCSQYNRIMSRKNLVDGSEAYKARKFAVAEDLFRQAAARDPEGSTVEGRTAQLFLARTLHSVYIGNRQQKEKADEAIREYQKSLKVDKNDQSSYKAIASLLENLQRPDEWQKLVTERANITDILPQYRAEALTALAVKQNNCATEISDTEATKKTVKVDGKDVFQFVKPADPAEFAKLQGCVAEGNKLIEQSVALEPEAVKNAKSVNIKSLSDEDLKKTNDLLNIFESARSYRASLVVQAMRLAEMEARTADQTRLKTDADSAKAQYNELRDVNRNFQTEIEARVAALTADANANANANAAQ